MEAALDKQASDILLLDLRPLCTFADYFVILSGESERQIEAICSEIENALEKEGVILCRREGNINSGWVILDFSGVIVHIFMPGQREYYNLESLWSKASSIVRIL